MQIYSQPPYCAVWRALSPMELPESAILSLIPTSELNSEVFASLSGPNTGLLAIETYEKPSREDFDILRSWKSIENRKAHGVSISLYERNPITKRVAGEPNADGFLVRARHNSAFLAVTDGLNWGKEAMRAARCALFAAYEHVERNLYHSSLSTPKSSPCKQNGAKLISSSSPFTTQIATQLLFEALSAAQTRIVKCTSGLTTLCIALCLPLRGEEKETVDRPTSNGHQPSVNGQKPSSRRQPHDRYAVMVVSVGDSRAFLLSKLHGIRELTGSVVQEGDAGVNGHNQQTEVRDFRNAGGALGPVYTNGKPELANLICAVTIAEPGDIVLLGSDGLTDNFDPVATRLAVPESPQLGFVDDGPTTSDASDDESSPPSTPRRFQLTRRSSCLAPLPPLSQPSLSIWPSPPPPPPPLESTNGNRRLSSNGNHSNIDGISARSLNFTNQLELSWPERRHYTSKEMERVWHELDAASSSPSARDLCIALMDQVINVTQVKRSFLQQPDVARVRTMLKNANSNGDTVDDVEAKRAWVSERLKLLSGKLDHATVVAYEVGHYNGDQNEIYEE